MCEKEPCARGENLAHFPPSLNSLKEGVGWLVGEGGRVEEVMKMGGRALLPFSVDTWGGEAMVKRKGHCFFFLTHAHSDHTVGIQIHTSFPIYCSPITALLLLQRFPKLDASLLVEMQIEEPLLIENDHESFTVTAFDANHCPGAIMFLFEGSFGRILHTGDCRLTKDCYFRLPPTCFNGSLDAIYLDCTFGKEDVKMPSKEEAIEQVKQCIWNHPEAPIVYLACDLLGQEVLLQSICSTFGERIFVDKSTLPDYYSSILITAPEIQTDNPKSTRFHVCEGFPKLYERAKKRFSEAREKGEAEPLFIRPSAQWYTFEERLEGAGSACCSDGRGAALFHPNGNGATIQRKRARLKAPTKAERDQFGVWHVCFSMHSSREELEAALQKLRPNWVYSTTPNCRADALSYVVKSVLSEGDEIAGGVKFTRILLAKNVSPPPKKKSIDDVEVKISPILDSSPDRPVPLFGLARENIIPPSPPMHFGSDSSPSSSHLFLPLAHHPSIRKTLNLNQPCANLLGNTKPTQPSHYHSSSLGNLPKSLMDNNNKNSTVTTTTSTVHGSGSTNIIPSSPPIIHLGLDSSSSLSRLSLPLVHYSSIRETRYLNQPHANLQHKTTYEPTHPQQKMSKDSSLSHSSSLGNLPKSLIDNDDKEGAITTTTTAHGSERHEEIMHDSSCGCSGKSGALGENTRRVYRSLRIPIPMPLPSLLEMARSRK